MNTAGPCVLLSVRAGSRFPLPKLPKLRLAPTGASFMAVLRFGGARLLSGSINRAKLLQ